jgi:hypothetical protein
MASGFVKPQVNIQYCNKVIFLLDSLEEHRSPFVTEFNSKQTVKLSKTNEIGRGQYQILSCYGHKEIWMELYPCVE